MEVSIEYEHNGIKEVILKATIIDSNEQNDINCAYCKRDEFVISKLDISELPELPALPALHNTKCFNFQCPYCHKHTFVVERRSISTGPARYYCRKQSKDIHWGVLLGFSKNTTITK